jgi:hypothetical protein
VADSKVSALTAVATPALSDEFPCNQGGASKKVSLQTLAAWQAAPIMAVLSADYTLTSSTIGAEALQQFHERGGDDPRRPLLDGVRGRHHRHVVDVR